MLTLDAVPVAAHRSVTPHSEKLQERISRPSRVPALLTTACSGISRADIEVDFVAARLSNFISLHEPASDIQGAATEENTHERLDRTTSDAMEIEMVPLEVKLADAPGARPLTEQPVPDRDSAAPESANVADKNLSEA